MSQYKNNITLHNLRVGVRMVQEGMPAEVASFAMAALGITAPQRCSPGLLSPA